MDGLYCTLPSRPGRDPFYVNPRYKGQPIPECWAKFDTAEERREHYRTAHAEYLADLDERGMAMLMDDRYYYDPEAFERDYPFRPAVDAEPADLSGIDTSDLNVDDEPGEYHEPTGARASTEATEKQLALIATLAERKGVDVPEVSTKAEASKAIDDLSVLPDRRFQANRFDGQCSECGQIVPAGEGFVRKDDATGKWITAHKDGSCAIERKATGVLNGFYAVDAEAGHTSFYKVTNGRKPGVVFVDLLLGGGPNGGFQRNPVPFRNRDAIVAKIVDAGPEVAAKRFADEADRCSVCGRGLTNDESREHGIGPECRKKVDA